MKTANSSLFLRKQLAIALAACFGFLACDHVHAATTPAVAIDQAPLTAQTTLPPDIVLMLDDSGSMAWDFMPDWDFLSDNSSVCLNAVGGVDSSTSGYGGCPQGDRRFYPGPTDASVNGVYYDPTTTYLPPPQESGQAYPNSGSDPNHPLATAYDNGFQSQTQTNDITDYSSPAQGFPYFTSVTATMPTTYASVPACNSGDGNPEQQRDGGWLCFHTTTTTTTYPPKYFLLFPYCKNGDTLGANNMCVHTQTETVPYTGAGDPTCPSGGTYGTPTVNMCNTTGQVTVQVFTYTTGTSPNYTEHYVGKVDDPAAGGTANDCNVVLTANPDADCVSDLATRQNVANWFSYYRTRILMAKSGLMSAFNTLPTDTRFGFGSINNNGQRNLASPIYNGDQSSISEVEPFSTQRSAFWQWLVGESANGGTPLQLALNDVGQYYKTSQPWQTSASDDTELSCRQSYAIMTTDGFWNTASIKSNADNQNGPTITGPNNTNYTYQAVAPYTENSQNTLADVAMTYWKQDLQPTLLNDVPTTSGDPAFWQHMTTFTLGMGFLPRNITGTAANGDSPPTIQDIFDFANNPKDSAISNFSWPKPSGSANNGNGSINNIADLAHAAVNGHGGFFSATNPQTFAAGIENALNSIGDRLGTGASLAANSTELNTNTTTFQAFYRTGAWSGDLKAFSVVVKGSTGTAALGPMKWQASAEMPAWNARTVDTCNPCSGSGLQQFQFDAANVGKLSSAQLAALNTAPAAPASSGAMPVPVINYLLGDESKTTDQTGGVYRSRVVPQEGVDLLGDIVDSQPVFVDDTPTAAYMNLSGYSTFIKDNSARTPAIWVAANDGMVHEFNANTGVEMFAFLPSAVITSGIADYANPNYGTSANPHQYFNDGQLTVADAQIDGSWATVLVGTTGTGPARAVYALNVTDPATPTLLWEHSAAEGGAYANIGQMNGKPLVVKTGTSTWSVLMGNGYNTGTGAVLLQFDLGTGDLTLRATSDTSAGDGLAAPNTWVPDPTSEISTAAYAGDLDGNVWCFDLTSNGSGGCPATEPLFKATEADGTTPQPITAGMLIGRDPTTQNLWLFFGTGRYLSQADLADHSVQTWYGIIVSPGPSQPTDLTTNLSSGRTALAQRKITAEVAASGTTLAARTVSTDTDMTNMSGWYIDLVSPVSGQQGERMVLPNQFQGSLLIGTTRIPIASDPCHPTGSGWIMAIEPFTGSNPTASFFDLNNDGSFNKLDLINGIPAAGVGFTSVPNAPIAVGNTLLASFDDTSTALINTAGTAGTFGRVSWRELITP